MKKILIIHTRYRHFGGEDAAVENEINLLKRHYEVKTIYFTNSINNYFYDLAAFITTRNKSSMNKLQLEINNFKPDIAYVHNTWFKASLGIFKVIEKFHIPVILKLHNFRYNCTKSIFSKHHLLGVDFCKACGYKKEDALFFNKSRTLMPASEPVPTAPGPTQLKVGLGECILFLAQISVNLLLDE